MKILVIDIETTGLCPVNDSIVEIGAVLLNTRNGRIKEKFHSLIKEHQIIPADSWIFNNSDLKHEDIINHGKSIEEIRKDLQKLFKKYSCTSYNQKFDFRFLAHRDFYFKKRTGDPMLILTNVLKIDCGFENYKWPSVQEVINFFGWNKTEPHRALEDAKLEAKIVLELIKRGLWKNEDIQMSKMQ